MRFTYLFDSDHVGPFLNDAHFSSPESISQDIFLEAIWKTLLSAVNCSAYQTNISARYVISRCFGLPNEVSVFQMSRALRLSHPVKMELAYQCPPGATRSSTAQMPLMRKTAVRLVF